MKFSEFLLNERTLEEGYDTNKNAKSLYSIFVGKIHLKDNFTTKFGIL